MRALLLRASLLSATLLTHCAASLTPPISNCQPFATRCEDELAQVCSPSQRWRTAQDCQQVEPADRGWRCCYTEEGRAACLPEGECNVCR